MKNSKLIFATKNNSDSTTIYALHEELFERINISDTYDMYGQKVDSSTAGDYLTLDTQKAVDLANKIYHENHAEYDDLEILQKFTLSDYISAYDYSDVYEEIITNKDLQEGVDFEIIAEKCVAYNYWDGNNWKTHTIHINQGEPSLNVITDKALIKKLRTSVTRRKYYRKGVGYIDYKYGNVVMTENNWQGSGWYYLEIKINQ